MKKVSILTLFCCLLLASKLTGQSLKVKHDFALKPLSDTAYVYIEGVHKCKSDWALVEVWQTDLQTGERWYSLCPKKENKLKSGMIVRMKRKEMQFIGKAE